MLPGTRPGSQPLAKDQAHGSADPRRMVANAEAYPAVDAERVAELVIEATKHIGSRRRVGGRVVLSIDLPVQASGLLQVIAEGKRLLTAIATAGRQLATSLDDGSVDEDVQIALFAVVVIEQQDRLLTVILQSILGGRRKFRSILNGDPGSCPVVVLFPQLNLAPKGYRSNALSGLAASALESVGRYTKVQSKPRVRGVVKVGGKCFKFTWPGLWKRVKANLNLKHAGALDRGAVGDRWTRWAKIQVLCCGLAAAQNKQEPGRAPCRK